MQEVTSTLSVYGIFMGAAVASRRNDHLYLTRCLTRSPAVPAPSLKS